MDNFALIPTLVFFLMLVVWSIDGCSIQSFVEPWRFNAYSVRISPSPSPLMSPIPNLESEKPFLQNLTFNTTTVVPRNLDPKKTNLTSNSTRVQFGWITAELKKNFTANLLRNWLAPGGAPCREAKTVEISVPGVDGNDSVELTTGEIYEFKFQAMDESGKPVCIGGDYFETDLSGESWKSRPPVKDFGNGTYSFSLQAIKVLNMIKLYGKPIRVNKASQDKKSLDVGANLFIGIGNLDPDVDEKLLYDTFSAFGVIASNPKIMRDPDTGNSRGFGFISYDSFEASDAAIEAMTGQYLCNRQITVSYAYKKDTKGERHGDTSCSS